MSGKKGSKYFLKIHWGPPPKKKKKNCEKREDDFSAILFAFHSCFLINRFESEFTDFEPRLKFVKIRFQMSAGNFKWKKKQYLSLFKFGLCAYYTVHAKLLLDYKIHDTDPQFYGLFNLKAGSNLKPKSMQILPISSQWLELKTFSVML